ncbi:hypothetical protein ACEWY4_001344 [Coilia grayii]|uniref:Uncharacterized protein n=1 Tax=Coilia grayii TaxID=363190 RepID=A0ABD1KSN6_9TELE
MESLLDNPMKAVLYLKELTTIVQNQQSLIQTQRQRIDELERKVEDLIGENRQLQGPHQFYHHHHLSPGSPTTQSPVHLQEHTVSAKTVILPGQTLQHVPSQSHPPQHPPPPPPTLHNPQHLQLVLTSPPSPKTGHLSPLSSKDDKRSICSTSLVTQTPSTIGRSLGLARTSENQTVLHQFCCPAPDPVEVDSQSCVPRYARQERLFWRSPFQKWLTVMTSSDIVITYDDNGSKKKGCRSFSVQGITIDGKYRAFSTLPISSEMSSE